MEVASGAGNCPKNGMVVPPNLPICYSYRRRQSLRSLPGKDVHDGEHGTSLLIDKQDLSKLQSMANAQPRIIGDGLQMLKDLLLFNFAIQIVASWKESMYT